MIFLRDANELACGTSLMSTERAANPEPMPWFGPQRLLSRMIRDRTAGPAEGPIAARYQICRQPFPWAAAGVAEKLASSIVIATALRPGNK